MRVILLKKQLTYSPTEGESIQSLPAIIFQKWREGRRGGGGKRGKKERTATPEKKSLTELFTNYDTLSRRQLVFGYQSVEIYFYFAQLGLGKGNGKAIPSQIWRGPKVSRILRLPDFKTIGT
jgi:hypothetical protein